MTQIRKVRLACNNIEGNRSVCGKQVSSPYWKLFRRDDLSCIKCCPSRTRDPDLLLKEVTCKTKIEFDVFLLPSLNEVIDDLRHKTSVKFLSEGNAGETRDRFIKGIENKCSTKVENQVYCLRHCAGPFTSLGRSTVVRALRSPRTTGRFDYILIVVQKRGLTGVPLSRLPRLQKCSVADAIPHDGGSPAWSRRLR